MERKVIVNGVEFAKVSHRKVEQIEAGCRQYRSEYIFSSIKSVAGFLIGSAQRVFGPLRKSEVSG